MLTDAHVGGGEEGRQILRQLWCYLNLAHACGYVGLTPVYDRRNLLDDLVKGREHRGVTAA